MITTSLFGERVLSMRTIWRKKTARSSGAMTAAAVKVLFIFRTSVSRTISAAFF
jgi:hypothetical protein